MGGLIFHVLNRGARKALLFRDAADFGRFEELLCRARARVPIRLLAYCLMPNHFHLVLWPENDGDLSTFMHWLTTTHSQNWHARGQTAGTGPVYQGRFKAFPVHNGPHFLTLCRYVERNALRAGLCGNAEAWRWCSLWHRCHNRNMLQCDPWPIPPPVDWLDELNKPREPGLGELRTCVSRSRPFGADDWVQSLAVELGVTSSLRSRGRPPASD
jgi:putative transposase